jgi:hypothetical protein
VARAVVAGGAAVADRDVEVAVRAEREVAGVVVALRLRDLQQCPLRPTIDAAAVRRRPELGQDEGVAVVLGRPRPSGGAVPDEQPSVVGVVGVERDAEQALLAAGEDGVSEVQERRLEPGTGLDGVDDALLFGQVGPVAAGREGDVQWRAAAVDDGLEPDGVGQSAVGVSVRVAGGVGRSRRAAVGIRRGAVGGFVPAAPGDPGTGAGGGEREEVASATVHVSDTGRGRK